MSRECSGFSNRKEVFFPDASPREFDMNNLRGKRRSLSLPAAPCRSLPMFNTLNSFLKRELRKIKRYEGIVWNFVLYMLELGRSDNERINESMNKSMNK